MDAQLKIAVALELFFLLAGAVFTEFLKHHRSVGLKNSPADKDATAARAWLGLAVTMAALGQLIMFGWVLLIVQTLIQRP